MTFAAWLRPTKTVRPPPPLDLEERHGAPTGRWWADLQWTDENGEPLGDDPDGPFDGYVVAVGDDYDYDKDYHYVGRPVSFGSFDRDAFLEAS